MCQEISNVQAEHFFSRKWATPTLQIRCLSNITKHAQDSFYLAPTCQQRHNNEDLFVDKQSNQISKLPVGSVAAQATNCVHQHPCRSHQVKTHHWHTFLSQCWSCSKGNWFFFYFFPCHLSPCTFCSKQQDCESIIIPMSNRAKESEDCNERTWIQNKQPGEMFLSGYKAGTDSEQ